MYGGNRSGGFRPRGGMGEPMAPVRVGEELDVKIEAVGEKGDGIAKKNGFVLFIPGVKEGQELHIRVTKVLRKVGFAEVVGSKSAEASPEESSEESTEETAEAPAEETAEATEESSEDSERVGEETAEKSEEQ